MFLDNDTTGLKVEKILKTELTKVISDYSTVYKEHKDFNLFLLSWYMGRSKNQQNNHFSILNYQNNNDNKDSYRKISSSKSLLFDE